MERVEKYSLEDFVIKKSKDMLLGIPIFQLHEPNCELVTAEWIGEDITTFLLYVKNINVPVLYIKSNFPSIENDDEKFSQYAECALTVEVGYFSNGIFHYFTQKSEWYEEYLSYIYTQEQGKEQKMEDLLKMDESKKKEIVNLFLNSNYCGNNPDELIPRSSFNQYLIEKEGFPKYLIDGLVQLTDEEITPDMEKIVNLASELFEPIKNNNYEIEENKLARLVEECIQWALKNKISTVAKTDIPVFLESCGHKITPNMEKRLLNTVKFEMKSRKGRGELPFK